MRFIDLGYHSLTKLDFKSKGNVYVTQILGIQLPIIKNLDISFDTFSVNSRKNQNLN